MEFFKPLFSLLSSIRSVNLSDKRETSAPFAFPGFA